MCHVQLFIEGGGGGDQNLSISSPFLPSQPPLPYPIHNTFTHLLHQCHLFPPYLFPTAMQPYPPCTLPYSSSHYNSPHLIHHTHRSLSNYPQVTIKCSTSFPAPLSHITPRIYTHFTFLLSSNNPAEPVLSLNNSLTIY